MAMMCIRVMRMAVAQPLVPVLVNARFGSRSFRAVEVVVMLIVQMLMNMLYFFVQMIVLVALADVKPDPKRHESQRQAETSRRRFVKDSQRNEGSYKRSEREIGPRPGGSQLSQSA